MKTAVEFAKEAGIIAYGDIRLEPKIIERLIELVRADEREACAKHLEAIGRYESAEFIRTRCQQ